MKRQPDMFEDMDAGGLPARIAALGLLQQIFAQKKMLDAALEGSREFTALPARDRAFVRMLIATVLRRRGQIDDIIGRCLNKGEKPKPDSLVWILYIGAAQILFMDVADHAAVDTAVTLTGQQHMEGKKGFVNAILRRIAGEGRGWAEKQDPSLNIPDWLLTQWVADYGIVRAKDMASASLQEAPLDITVKHPSEKDDIARALDASVLPTRSLRRSSGGAIASLPGFGEGAWWIQDASSAIPATLFGGLEGKTVLDLCAAPGGKTMQLAAQGAHIVALDRSAGRMAILQENLKRVGLEHRVKTVIEDGSVWKPRDQFPLILLDAPCTATGTIRRHPDLLALKAQKDQDGLENVQSRLLSNAFALLEPGGTLIYCTCSLQKAEGEKQVESFLASHPTMVRRPIRREEINNLEGVVNAYGDVRILPYHLKDIGGMDGFFISRLVKAA
jgi:16S rRNA (cytosine967-C5)-methyltransferase